MSPQIERALELEPGTYTDREEEYKILNALTQEEYSDYLDILAIDGRNCSYSNSDNESDSFTVT